MISKLEICNYQSHKNTTFTFCPNVNAITGSSNSGKSSSLRALKWVADNKAGGEGDIAWWTWDEKGKQTDSMSVKYYLDNGITVERKRDKKDNCYILTKPGEEPIQYDALNRGVPPQIAEALNFTETNIQSQHDGPFLMRISAGERGAFFNKIAHFDAIDRYQSAILSAKKDTNSELKLARENLERVDEDLKKFDWIPMAQKLLKKIEELEKKKEEIDFTVGELKESLDMWERQQKILEQTAVIGDAEELVTNCTQLRLSVEDLEQKIFNISNMIKTYQTNEDIVDKYDFIVAAEQLVLGIDPALSFSKSYETDIKALKQFIADYMAQNELSSNTDMLPMAEKLVNKISMLREENQKLLPDIDDFVDWLVSVRENTTIINGFEQEYEELQGQLPPNCPTCGHLLEEV